jgi:hypothetical protein
LVLIVLRQTAVHCMQVSCRVLPEHCTGNQRSSSFAACLPAQLLLLLLFCRRGKRNQKHFTVFVADVQASAAQQFVPRLNAEHSEWRWVPWEEVIAASSGAVNGFELHPVVRKLAQQHAPAVRNVLQACQQERGGGCMS